MIGKAWLRYVLVASSSPSLPFLRPRQTRPATNHTFLQHIRDESTSRIQFAYTESRHFVTLVTNPRPWSSTQGYQIMHETDNVLYQMR